MRRILLSLLPLLALSSPAHAQSFAERVVELVNLARWDNGQLPPLKSEALLTGAAQAHSEAMALHDFMMHCDPDTGLSPFQRMTNAGYLWNNAAENIAAGQGTPEAVMNTWMNSSGHRTNILNAGLREIGVGYFHQANDQGGVRFTSTGGCTPNSSYSALYRYWTQKFGRRNTVYPVVIAREAYQTSQCLIDVYVHGSGFATQMRLSNDGTAWGPWQSYASNVLWQLTGRSGETVRLHAQIRNGTTTLPSEVDDIRLSVDCSPDGLFRDGFE